MLIFNSNIHAVNKVKSLLNANFKMEDFEEANPGIKITRSEKGLSLDQSRYIEKILNKYNYFECRLVCTPYDQVLSYLKMRDNKNMQVSSAVLDMLLMALEPT